MADHDRLDHATSGHTQPVDAPRPEHEQAPGDRTQPRPSGPTDAGRTSGGGSLGHVQPDRVEREAPLRNNAERRGSEEPTLPSDDATLNTRI